MQIKRCHKRQDKLVTTTSLELHTHAHMHTRTAHLYFVWCFATQLVYVFIQLASCLAKSHLLPHLVDDLVNQCLAGVASLALYNHSFCLALFILSFWLTLISGTLTFVRKWVAHATGHRFLLPHTHTTMSLKWEWHFVAHVFFVCIGYQSCLWRLLRAPPAITSHRTPLLKLQLQLQPTAAGVNCKWVSVQ